VEKGWRGGDGKECGNLHFASKGGGAKLKSPSKGVYEPENLRTWGTEGRFLGEIRKE